MYKQKYKRENTQLLNSPISKEYISFHVQMRVGERYISIHREKIQVKSKSLIARFEKKPHMNSPSWACLIKVLFFMKLDRTKMLNQNVH